MKAPITLFLIFACAFFFIWQQFSVPAKGLSPVEKALFFDYTVFDAQLENYENNPSAENAKKVQESSFWPGLYALFTVKKAELPSPPYPLFEKIKQGEIWRLLSPIFLHAHLFHLFFNVVWLFFFGTLIEQKIGSFRYIFLIILTALVSNMAQYLMSGPRFLGISGVLMGLIGFIFARKKKAPLENWPVPRATLMMLIWITGLTACLQMFFFFLELLGLPSFSTYLANTAHITGLMAGFCLGLIPYFKERSYERT